MLHHNSTLLSQTLSLTPIERLYSTYPMIFILMTVNKMGGITFQLAGVYTIHGDLMMAKHSNDIMVIT